MLLSDNKKVLLYYYINTIGEKTISRYSVAVVAAQTNKGSGEIGR